MRPTCRFESIEQIGDSPQWRKFKSPSIMSGEACFNSTIKSIIGEIAVGVDEWNPGINILKRRLRCPERAAKESPQAILASLSFPSEAELSSADDLKLHTAWARNHERLLQLLKENVVPFIGLHGSKTPDHKRLIHEYLYFATLTKFNDPEQTLIALMNMCLYVCRYAMKGQKSENVDPGCIVIVKRQENEIHRKYGFLDGPLNRNISYFESLPYDTGRHLRLVRTSPVDAAAGMVAELLGSSTDNFGHGIFNNLAGVIDGKSIKDDLNMLFISPIGLRETVKRIICQKIVAKVLKIVFP